MNAHILCVGTEILLGDIVNTNTQFLAQRLAQSGVGVYSQSVVGDNPERLKAAFKDAFDKGVDLILTTGGLGPTKDDLTKEVAAEFFGLKLYEDEKTANKIKEFFVRQNLILTDDNKKQALIPEGAIIMENPNGTAPGVIIEKDGKAIILMPGPPFEMIPMFENKVVTYLASRQEGTLVSRTLRFCDAGESFVATTVSDLLDNENPTVAPYAKQNECHLRITARASQKDEAYKLIEPVAAEIYKRLGDKIYGEDETDMSMTVYKLLKEKGLTLAVAESCTGGLLTSTLVGSAGISEVLKEGIVAYSNESKMKRLGVKEETLRKFGAVSHETALEMAAGVAEGAGANIGISTTGIAGPDGGTDEKPVGLVYVGICINGKTNTKEYKILGSRERIRMRATANTLSWLWNELKDV